MWRQLPPVLRYRLREGCARPSSLAHTGEVLRDPAAAAAGRREGRLGLSLDSYRSFVGGALSWVEQFPSDFVYNRHFIRNGGGVAALAAALAGFSGPEGGIPGVQAAGDLETIPAAMVKAAGKEFAAAAPPRPAGLGGDLRPSLAGVWVSGGDDGAATTAAGTAHGDVSDDGSGSGLDGAGPDLDRRGSGQAAAGRGYAERQAGL